MLTVNLWDDTFRHDVGSVAGKPPTRIEYVRDRTQWNGVTLFVDGCAQPETVRQVQSRVRVGWLHEPYCLHPGPYDKVDWDCLDLVLTYHEPFLHHPKARLLLYGGVWIPRERWDMRPKTKLCSMLIGDKVATPGHRLRHEVAAAVRGLGVDFYGVLGEPVEYGAAAKEKVLADYAFSIIVENCREANYFDEWLLDCFALGTVPIFWGCPNIDKWFDIDGILPFSKPQDAAWWVERLGTDLYQELRPGAENNLGLIGQYEITDDLVADALMAEGYA